MRTFFTISLFVADIRLRSLFCVFDSLPKNFFLLFQSEYYILNPYKEKKIKLPNSKLKTLLKSDDKQSA